MNSRILLGALGAAAFAAMLGTGAAVAEPTVVKIGSFTPPKAGFMRAITIPYLRKVEKDSGGTVKFQEFWGGALIRSPAKQWEGVMNGIQDASQIVTAYTPKLFPDFTIFSLPFTFEGAGAFEAATAIWKMYEKGMLGGLDRAHVFAVYANDNSGIHLNRTITSLNEIKGLKFRAPGGDEADTVKALGGTPVGMAITQVAESLNRGVIQGTLAGWSALGTFRITPLIKTHVDLPLGVRTFFLCIRKDLYNKLPRQAQQAVDSNGGLKLSQAYGRYYEHDGVTLRAHPGKRTIVRPSKEVRTRLYNDIFKSFHTRWIAEHEDGQKKYDALMAILADLRKNT